MVTRVGSLCLRTKVLSPKLRRRKVFTETSVEPWDGERGSDPRGGTNEVRCVYQGI